MQELWLARAASAGSCSLVRWYSPIDERRVWPAVTRSGAVIQGDGYPDRFGRHPPDHANQRQGDYFFRALARNLQMGSSEGFGTVEQDKIVLTVNQQPR